MVIVAGVSAFLVNNFCVLLLLGTGLIDQWFFVKPLLKLALDIEPTFLGIVAFYMLGFFQYFIIFLLLLATMASFRRKKPPVL